MIPAKFSYFLNDGYYASFNPFLNIFFISLGLTATQAGLITGISFAVSALAGPLWGILADSTGYRKLIYIILCFGTASTVFSMPWIAKATIEKTENNLTCLDNHTTTEISAVTSNCTSSYHLLNSDHLFYTLLSLNIIARIFFGALPCYIDGIVMNIVTQRQDTSYGAQKVFSPIGYAFFNFLSGVAIDHYKPKDMSQYTASFFVFLPCIVCLTPIGFILVRQAKWEENDNISNDNISVATHIISVCRRYDTIIFLLTVTVSGFALNIFQGFCFLLMDEMQASKITMTLAVVICTISELTVYPFSSDLIRLLRGPIPCIAIGIFSYFPRYMLMSYVVNPWLILPIQLLQGIGLSLSWAAQIEHTYKLFPREVKMTAITIVSSIHYVASGSIANVLGGIVYHNYGGRILFRGCAVICVTWSIFVAIYFKVRNQKERSQSKSKQLIRC